MKAIAAASLVMLLVGCAQLGLQPRSQRRPMPAPPPPQLTQADPAYVQASLDRVKQTLKDPDAAQFSNIYATVLDPDQEEGPSVCGTVNAKNSYGGYAGDVRFLVTPESRYGVPPTVYWDDQSSSLVRMHCAVPQ